MDEKPTMRVHVNEGGVSFTASPAEIYEQGGKALLVDNHDRIIGLVYSHITGRDADGNPLYGVVVSYEVEI